MNTSPQPARDTSHEPALVLLSGGQDSTTCLFWAVEHFEKVHAVVFDYGQRHSIEIAQARRIASLANIKPVVLKVHSLAELGGSSLVDQSMALPQGAPAPEEVPNTFVPGRNLIFLSLAAALAYKLGVNNIVAGVCETDSSNYPDCTQGFIDSAERTISLAMGRSFELHAPLMNLDKAGIWLLAAELGCLDVVISDSHTCYKGDHSTLHPWGYGCGQCAACELRMKGFYRAFPDRKPKEGKVQ